MEKDDVNNGDGDWNIGFLPPGGGEKLPILKMDGRNGDWALKRIGQEHTERPWEDANGGKMGNPTVSIVTTRPVRLLYDAPYSASRKPKLACGSWNGKHAFGFGDRTGKQAMERLCSQCPSAQRGKNNEPPKCKEQLKSLVLVWVGDEFEPAWFEANGAKYFAWRRIAQGVEAEQRRVPQARTFFKRLRIKSEATPNGGYKPAVEDVEIIPGGERSERLITDVETICREHLMADIEDMEQRCRAVGDDGAPAAEGKPDDPGHKPFGKGPSRKEKLGTDGGGFVERDNIPF